MKYKIILILTSIFLVYGSTYASPKKGDTDNTKKTETGEQNLDENIRSIIEHQIEPPFRLNGTQKWKVDDFTRDRIEILNNMIVQFLKDKRNDYNQFGEELQVVALSINNECKVQDPDRGALFAFMAPVIGNTDMIKKVHDKKLAAKVVLTLQNRLKSFGNFFE